SAYCSLLPASRSGFTSNDSHAAPFCRRRLPETAMPHSAETPAPPYFAVIFTSIRSSSDPEGYGKTAERMLELARQQPGFLGVESAHGEDGLGITVSYWSSLEAVRHWRAQAVHVVAQEQVRAKSYDRYWLRDRRDVLQHTVCRPQLCGRTFLGLQSACRRRLHARHGRHSPAGNSQRANVLAALLADAAALLVLRADNLDHELHCVCQRQRSA